MRRGVLAVLGGALVLLQLATLAATAAEIGRSRGHGTFCCG